MQAHRFELCASSPKPNRGGGVIQRVDAASSSASCATRDAALAAPASRHLRASRANPRRQGQSACRRTHRSAPSRPRNRLNKVVIKSKKLTTRSNLPLGLLAEGPAGPVVVGFCPALTILDPHSSCKQSTQAACPIVRPGVWLLARACGCSGNLCQTVTILRPTRRFGSPLRLRLPSPMARCQHRDCGAKLPAGGSSSSASQVRIIRHWPISNG